MDNNLFFPFSFIIACTLLNIAPGPDIFYIITRDITQGKKSAFYSVFAICLCDIFHTIMAVLGLSFILMTSAIAFKIIKYLGAGYLVYLGITTLMKKENFLQIKSKSKKPSKVFIQTLVAGILNPKLAVFFISFFPQFVDFNKNNVNFQMMILGIILMINTFIIFSIFAFFSGSLGLFFEKNKRIKKLLNWFAGTFFIGLGIRLIFEKNK